MMKIVFTVMVLMGLGLGGCASYRPMEIQPAKGSAIVPKFNDAYYYYDRDKNVYFVMRSKTVDEKTKKPVDQIFTARVFWKPIGGRTSMNPTSLNATYRYVLMTDDKVGMYEGAGFIRLWGVPGSATLKARIMDGDMRLTQASNSFVDTLQRARLKGNFAGTYNDVKAMDMLMAAQREFFGRSLLKQPEASATQPGAPRAPENVEPFAPPVVRPPATQP